MTRRSLSASPGASRRWRERRALRARFQFQTALGSAAQTVAEPKQRPSEPPLPSAWEEQIERALERLRSEPSPSCPFAAEMLQRTLEAGETAKSALLNTQRILDRRRRLRESQLL